MRTIVLAALAVSLAAPAAMAQVGIGPTPSDQAASADAAAAHHHRKVARKAAHHGNYHKAAKASQKADAESNAAAANADAPR